MEPDADQRNLGLQAPGLLGSNRCARLRQFGRRLPRGQGPLQEVDPFVELLELLSELMSDWVGGDRTTALDPLRERHGDRPQDSDEYPAGSHKPAKVNQSEVMHGFRPDVGTAAQRECAPDCGPIIPASEPTYGPRGPPPPFGPSGCLRGLDSR